MLDVEELFIFESKLDEISARYEHSPLKSLKCLTQEIKNRQ